MLPRQKRLLILLGLVPVCMGILLAILVITNYHGYDFANVTDWNSFVSALSLLCSRIFWTIRILLFSGCFFLGFTLTLNILWMISSTMASFGNDISGKDELRFPIWIPILFAFFWLVPIVLGLCDGLFKAIDIRLYIFLQILVNLACILPILALLIWIACARRQIVCKEDEVLKHPLRHLLLMLFWLVLSVAVSLIPEPKVFDNFINSSFPWLANCGIAAQEIFKWLKWAVSGLFLLWAAFHFLLWRLLWVVKPKKKKDQNKKEDKEKDESASSVDIPPAAEYLINHLPEGIIIDGDVELQSITEFSNPNADGGREFGLDYLMGGLVPTGDQVDFFRRFVNSYNEAHTLLHENLDPRKSCLNADIILQGEDGSGRTEIMLAAAMYAAVVRGQHVLYLVPTHEIAKLLSAKINDRFESLMIGCYYSSGVLSEGVVDGWLDVEAKEYPQNIIFTTAETVERAFFVNPNTIDSKKCARLKSILVDFGAFFVDDFMDLSITFRSHTAFILDKFRLLQAGECAVAQYVVATTPLFSPDGVEALGSRLFGFGQFNRRQNVFSLRPRPCGPYWVGTLRVAHYVLGKAMSLEEASRKLVQITLDGKFKALLYCKGMSSPEKAKFNDDFKSEVKDGKVSVVSHLYEIDALRQKPDNVFYLSLTCGNAGAALRLNLGEGDDQGTVFFKIAMEGEPINNSGECFALLPDETALPLRVHHLRSVLQFIDHKTPVESNVWARFGISLNHPCLREANAKNNVGGQISVSWLHDEIIEKDRYSDDQIWPYMVLESKPAVSNRGSMVNFNVMPNSFDGIWRDSRSSDERLMLSKAETIENENDGQLVVWRDSRGEKIGESDLSHADELVYLTDEEYTAANLQMPDENESNRYVLKIKAQYRRGSDSDFIYPVRRLQWEIPEGGLQIPDIRVLEEIAQFKIERKNTVTYRVEGLLKGLLNLQGEMLKALPARPYSYDSYISCMVLVPALSEDELESEDPAGYVSQCINGTWRTEASYGYSCALTHALSIAFRQRLSGLSFFTIIPAFFIEGREGSIGKVILWFLEPSNSGRTVYPVLERLMAENKDFRREIFESAKTILESCQSLEELRIASRMAFADEVLTEDDRKKAIKLLELLISKDKLAESEAARLQEKERKRQGYKPPVRKVGDSYTPEEREFDRVVVKALMNFEESIDVTKFAVEYGWDCDRISDLFTDVLWNNPQVFFVAKKGRYQWWEDTDGVIKRFIITDFMYDIAKEDYPVRKVELDKAVSEALKTIDGIDDPVEKAKRLHDYIVCVCEYDTVAADENDSSPLARTVYSVLVRHLAVCEGYTMAYRYLLQKAGIRSEEIISNKMKHCWNYVQISDNWYHVDVTWDDPIYAGKNPATDPILRDHFLLSDEAILAKKHYDWEVRGLPPATDTTFDRRKWD